MAGIFISYRREDTGGYAGRLFDRLSAHFGRENIFMDVDTIEPGLDFVQAIEQAVGACDVLIALIGHQWMTSQLENPEDFVRLEVATALARNVRVIPMLIQDAPMPISTTLPDDLKPLSRRNALQVSDTRFHNDIDGLIKVLDRTIGGVELPDVPMGKVT